MEKWIRRQQNNVEGSHGQEKRKGKGGQPREAPKETGPGERLILLRIEREQM